MVKKLIIGVLAVAGLAAFFGLPPYLNHKKVQRALNDSACALLTPDAVRDDLGQPSLKVVRKPNAAETANDGPVSNCNYFMGGDMAEPKLVVTIWCQDAAHRAHKLWSGTSNKKVLTFSVGRDIFGIVQYHGKSSDRHQLRDDVKENEKQVRFCPVE